MRIVPCGSVPSAVASTVVVAAMIRLFTIAERQSGDDSNCSNQRHENPQQPDIDVVQPTHVFPLPAHSPRRRSDDGHTSTLFDVWF